MKTLIGWLQGAAFTIILSAAMWRDPFLAYKVNAGVISLLIVAVVVERKQWEKRQKATPVDPRSFGPSPILTSPVNAHLRPAPPALPMPRAITEMRLACYELIDRAIAVDNRNLAGWLKVVHSKLCDAEQISRGNDPT